MSRLNVFNGGGYIEGNKDHKEKLSANDLNLPPDLVPDKLQDNQMSIADYEALQDEANEKEILLPSTFNRNVNRVVVKDKSMSEDDILLPAGIHAK